MKGDIYLLINEDDGTPVAKFESSEDCSVAGRVYTANGWPDDPDDIDNIDWRYVAEVEMSYLGSVQWKFDGEDYVTCCAGCFAAHIQTMCFVWALAPMIYGTDEAFDEYYYYTTANKLVDLMLEGYTIKKFEKENTNADN
jgi:hypothetical protein